MTNISSEQFSVSSIFVPLEWHSFLCVPFFFIYFVSGVDNERGESWENHLTEDDYDTTTPKMLFLYWVLWYGTKS